MLRTSLLRALSLAVLVFGAASAGCVDAADEGAFTVMPAGDMALPAGRLCGGVYDIPRETRRLPDFEALRPFEVLCMDRLDVPLRNGFPGFPGVRGRYEWFGMDLQGVVEVREPGTFRFRLSSDDGSRLFVDDALVVDVDGYHDVRTAEGAVTLGAGEHRIRVAFYNGPGPLALILEVARPGESYRIFRANRPLVGRGEAPASP